MTRSRTASTSAAAMLHAYANGIFPMAESRESDELFWLAPEPRAILPLDNLHISASLRRRCRRQSFRISVDQDFQRIVSACAEAAPGRVQTWINPQLQHLYLQLHQSGFAHSIECRQRERLAGGIFGIALGAAFFAESMFTRISDAGNISLLHLMARLRDGGFRLLDVQFITPHLQKFGAVEIPRAVYHARLASALSQRADFHRFRHDDSPAAVLHASLARDTMIPLSKTGQAT